MSTETFTPEEQEHLRVEYESWTKERLEQHYNELFFKIRLIEDILHKRAPITLLGAPRHN